PWFSSFCASASRRLRSASYLLTDCCHSRSISTADLTPCVGASGSDAGVGACAKSSGAAASRNRGRQRTNFFIDPHRKSLERVSANAFIRRSNSDMKNALDIFPYGYVLFRSWRVLPPVPMLLTRWLSLAGERFSPRSLCVNVRWVKSYWHWGSTSLRCRNIFECCARLAWSMYAETAVISCTGPMLRGFARCTNGQRHSSAIGRISWIASRNVPKKKPAEFAGTPERINDAGNS